MWSGPADPSSGVDRSANCRLGCGGGSREARLSSGCLARSGDDFKLEIMQMAEDLEAELARIQALTKR